MKRKYKIIILVIAVIAVFVILKLAGNNYNNRKISSVDIDIDTQSGPALIKEDEILQLISKGYDSLTSRMVSEIDLVWIEDAVRKNPFVQNVEVYVDADACLNLRIVQRRPILRVFNAKNQTYFIDSGGGLMQLSKGAFSELMVATGNFNDAFKTGVHFRKIWSVSYQQARRLPTLHKLYLIASAIEKDAFLKKLITQIYVNSNNSFELIPVIGDQNILIGDVDEINIKLDNLRHFYQDGYDEVDFQQYKTFDIRFQNQVVCIKKDTTI